MKKIAILALFLTLGTAAYAQRQAEVIPGRTPVSPKLEDYFTPSTDVAATPDADGFIGRWLLLEPIAKPNRSNTVFTDSYLDEVFAKSYFKGQLAEFPKDGQKVKVEVDVTPQVSGFPMPGQEPQAAPEQKFEKRTLLWHSLDSKLFNVKLFRFASGLQKDVYGVIFWMCTYVDCPEDMDNVRLAVGCNGASKWWVNGEEVVLMSSDRRMVQDDVMSRRISLKKGRNVIWGSLINGPGMSDFCLRFIDEAGQPVTNLSINTK